MVLQALSLKCQLDIQEVMSHRGLDNPTEFRGEVWARDMNVAVSGSLEARRLNGISSGMQIGGR